MRDQLQRGKNMSSHNKGKGRSGRPANDYTRFGSDEFGRRRSRRRQLEELAEMEADEMLREDEPDEIRPA